MTLHIRCQTLDRRTRIRYIVDRHDPTARERDEIERVTRQGEQRVEQAKLVQRVLPRRPEPGDGVRLGVARAVKQDGNEELERRRVNAEPVRTVECGDEGRPVQVGVLRICVSLVGLESITAYLNTYQATEGSYQGTNVRELLPFGGIARKGDYYLYHILISGLCALRVSKAEQ